METEFNHQTREGHDNVRLKHLSIGLDTPNFFDGQSSLEQEGYRIISFAESVKYQRSKDIFYLRVAHFTREAYVCLSKDEVYLVRTSPILEASEEQISHYLSSSYASFVPTEKQIEDALKNSVRLPLKEFEDRYSCLSGKLKVKRILTEDFSDNQLIATLFEGTHGQNSELDKKDIDEWKRYRVEKRSTDLSIVLLDDKEEIKLPSCFQVVYQPGNLLFSESLNSASLDLDSLILFGIK